METLGKRREYLQETLRETAEIKSRAFDEETLIASEKLNKKCNDALRYARQGKD